MRAPLPSALDVEADEAHVRLARLTVRLSLAAIALVSLAWLLPLARAQPDAGNTQTAALAAAAEAGLLTGVVTTAESVRAGQRAVNGGTKAGPGAACFNCHGMQGEGDAGGGFPRLAGLPAWYLEKQLSNYADGSRPNAVMTPIAVQMSAAERRDSAIYYATLLPPPTRAAGFDAALIQQGATIAAVGSAARGLQACANCHGPSGAGVPPDVPALAGQNARYMELQLQAWHEGTRNNDVLGVMRDVASRLSAEERRALAQYYASLPAPRAGR
jgi:cytochrome c553